MGIGQPLRARLSHMCAMLAVSFCIAIHTVLAAIHAAQAMGRCLVALLQAGVAKVWKLCRRW